MRGVAAAVACALVASCAWPVTGDVDTPRIWSVRDRRFVTERELVADLVRARHRLLGEMHDNPSHHALRARLVREIADAGVRPAVVFEQFDVDNDAALVAAQRDASDAERVADAGRLDRTAWRWPLHKPIVEAALAAHLPIRAGNVSRARLRAGPGAPAEAMEARAHARLAAASWTEAQAAALADDIVEGHCGKLPASVVPRLVQAQRLRDAAMAQALVEAATGDGTVLIAGNGHVRADFGVPAYLRDDGRVVGVGFVETTDVVRRAGAPPAGRSGFDYLWLTPAAPREDPCASLALPPPRGR